MKHQDLIEKLTLEEKVQLLSGKDAFTSKAFEKINLPSVNFADGPFGIRKARVENQVNPHDSIPATCFPSPALLASSWDPKLVEEVGKAIGEEAVASDIAIHLAPGTNIKRSPLNGRNFEYMSEDPLLAGEISAGYIKGVQSTGVSSTLKHFACNNQETRRMTVNAVVDERALREIYLRPFEIAIKKANPKAVMCAYNKLNGVYCSENSKLLSDILRKEWGFKGIVMSDWGATNIRSEGVKSGLDLEMPGNGGMSDEEVLNSIKEKKLDEEILNKRVDDLLEFLLEASKINKEGEKDDKKEGEETPKYDITKHKNIATKAVEQSAILLKNNGNVLPLKKDTKILVIGEMAIKPRFQGGGSSFVNPTELKSFVDQLTECNYPFDYKQGYELSSTKPNNKLIKQCTDVALQYPKIVVICGLPAEKESEGYDRTSLNLPDCQTRLIYELSKFNKNIIAVLHTGSVVTIPFVDIVESLLLMYLPGQMGNLGCIKLLYGDANPCGKLAESFPKELCDTPCSSYFPGDIKRSIYRESIYVGYRYYDSAKIPVLFPFGYGLSYSKFKYSDLKLSSDNISDKDKLEVSFKVENDSDVNGYEITQLYVHDEKSTIFRPNKELRAFKKVPVKARGSITVKLTLDKSAFAYYNVEEKDWCVESGEFTILVGSNVNDLPLSEKVTVKSSKEDVKITDLSSDCKWYFEPSKGVIPIEQFEKLYGEKIDTDISMPVKGSYTSDNTLEEISAHSNVGKKALESLKTSLMENMKCGPNDIALLMMYESMKCSPIKNLPRGSGGMITQARVDEIITQCNTQD